MTVSFLPAPETTVVTGAAGWFGTALMHEITDAASRWPRHGLVRALVERPAEARRLESISGQIECVVGDVRRPADIDRLFDGATGAIDVIHAAGVIHPATIDDFRTVNVDGTRRILDGARAASVRRFVHVSSNSPFGTNAHPAERFRRDEPYRPYYGYGRSKMEGELCVLDAATDGIHTTIVRPPWFYGPYQPPRQTTFFRMVKRGRFPVFGDGEQRRSMVYVGNLVDGVLRAELADVAPGSAWWVADAQAYSVNEIVSTVGRALRDEGFEVSPNRFNVPDIVGRVAERADAVLQRSGRYQQQIHVLGEMNKNIACDIESTRLDLGYQPAVALYDGMRTSIRWCLDQGYEL